VQSTAPESEIRNQKSEILRVVVNDMGAVYPVRIDPTFSDANWSSMGGIPGADNTVYAAVVDDAGNLYIGGEFNVVGEVIASCVAKWDGSSWSALGSGISGGVSALAVSGSDLYAGGSFLTAGGKVSASIARAYLPALPTLSVLHSNEQVTISWPALDTAGFALEQAGSLAAPSLWVPNSATITDDGANKSVTLPATDSLRLFRLRRP
jgi:hypothetical protein